MANSKVPKVIVCAVLFLVSVAFADDTDNLQIGKIVEYFAERGLNSTDVGGLICSNTTWTLAGSPYTVTGGSGIVIGCGATLTIEAGVVVKFSSTLAIVVGSAAFGNGTLVARGNEESPIIFTSVKDPCNVLDPAKPGDWSRIHFTDYAVDAVFDVNQYVSGCIIENAIIEYAGYSNYGAIFAEKSSPFLNYCEIRHNSYYGIKADGTSAPSMKITNCQVWDHPKRGIYISGGVGGNKLLNNNIHDNRDGGICFGSNGGNTVNGNTITNNTTGDYGGGIYFQGSIGNTITGNTIANNTAGYLGGGIYFLGSTGNTITGNSITNNMSGYYGGGGMNFWNSGGNTINGNIVTNNEASGPYGGGGIFFWDSGGNTINGNTITDNMAGGAGGGGVCFLYNSGDTTLGGNNISSNTSGSEGGGIYISDYSDNITFSGNTITDNRIIGTGTTGGVFVTDDLQYVSLAGDPDAGTYNIIWGNDGYQVYNNNSFNADGRNDINARYVQWGTCDVVEIQALIFDFFDNSAKAFVLFWPYICPGDFDMDSDVDVLDLATLVDNWLREDCNIPDWCEGADIDVSTNVDFYDFAEFANNWLEGL